ncbi:2-hydroxyacid dehydrogenase [Gluconobacter kanchanaburiensis]|uniref:Dehydrogenase n=1 Tax=Gluconobacter kanchanaburiensis NBRC 103587 TaxID=1307948 RepID=A0A511B7N3_9PROT|nr:2-hydroxyacid dehydrogenase [Gluconobacter kanchanaburiensis]MBF0861331.1 2-hydroxyacid dehydrogenase [Gluconobacter kanchanaburiensis]GBR68088.1 D-isomer-specific 2-hydroxyacid dehydrogenase [Gluconobacter kanchanaburiensis NBRC 103587]GEK95691.1 dehydrogenase [Gluconobacter kanchanaburiensis NBRC 103587]
MSSYPDILAIDPMPDVMRERLEKIFTIHPFTSLENLKAISTRIRGVTTGGGSGVSTEIMDMLPNLEVISVNGVGTDRIDLNEASRRNIRVATTQNTLTDDVADMAIVLMMTVMRGIITNDQFVRAGKWPSAPLPMGHSLTGKRVGIAGFGHIGQAIAKRVSAFNMEVAYFNSRARPESRYRYEPDLKALAGWCDVLILAVSGGPRSTNMVNAEILDALGKNGVLVNIARGTVVDETALIKYLRQNEIAGAGLDVFQNEPQINHDFFSLSNVVLQAHQASATIETRAAMANLVADNIITYFNEGKVLTPVN